MTASKWIRQHSPQDNACAALLNLLHCMNVPVTEETARETVTTNYNYPSLAAIAESLEQWHIENMAVKIQPVQLYEASFPCIAHLHKHGGHFVVITGLTDDRITYIDPEQGYITSSLTGFANLWTGAALLVNATETSGEPGYHAKRKNKQVKNIRLPVAITILSALTILSLIGAFGLYTLSILAIGALKILGISLSVLLLLHYFSGDSPFIQRLCPAGRMLNCKSVLHSPAAKILGIPVADLGVLYFSGGIFSIIFASLSRDFSTLWFFLAALNLLTLPYTLFSLYYQAFVARQWCWMCVGIQVLFWAEFALFALTGWPDLPATDLTALLPVLLGFFFPLAAWLALRPAIENATRYKPLTTEFMRIKNNPHVLRALLSAQPPVNMQLGVPVEISAGPDTAPFVVTMVSNPACSLCALTHQHLDHLINEFPETLRYRVRFYCPSESADRQMAAIIVSNAREHGNEYALKALAAAYHSRSINTIAAWKAKYAASRAHDVAAEETLSAHTRWSASLGISATPAFFINDHRMPPGFSLYDLKPLLRASKQEARATQPA